MGGVYCFWFLSVLVSFVESKQICEFEDTECMTKAAKNAYKTVIDGIEGLIEPTDKLQIQEITGKIAPDFKYVLRNATMQGIKDCKVTELKANRKRLVFDFGLRCPKQMINYDFTAKGNLGTVDVDNKGQIEVTLADLNEAYIKRRNVKQIEKNLRFSIIEAFMRVFMEKVNTYFKAYPVVELITI